MQVVQKYLLWGATALFVYMPFHIFIALWLSTFTGGLDAWKIGKDVFTALMTLLCVGMVLYARKYTRLYLWLLGLSTLYLLIHLFLMSATNQPRDTGLLATTYNLRPFGYTIIGYSLALLAPKQFNARYLARILIIITTAVCLLALVQRVLPTDTLTHFGYSIERGIKPAFIIDNKADLPRVFSTLRDPNSLGAFLILPSTIILLALIKFWKTEKRLLLLGLLCLYGWVNILTFSRSGWLGMFSAHAVAVAFIYGKQVLAYLRRYLPVVIVVVALMIVGVVASRDQYVVQNVIFHSDENTTQTDSNNLHVIQIEKGLNGARDKPLGHGPGTAGPVSVHNSNSLVTENYFLQIAYEVGVFGLLIFLALLYMIVLNLWGGRRDPINQALLASFVGLVLANMLLHTWANEAVACAWFMLAGTALAHKTKSSKVTQTVI